MVCSSYFGFIQDLVLNHVGRVKISCITTEKNTEKKICFPVSENFTVRSSTKLNTKRGGRVKDPLYFLKNTSL